MDHGISEIRVLHVWTRGDTQAGVVAESANVVAPSHLLTSEGMGPVELQILLADFKAKILEAFALIWQERPHALYDFELILGGAAKAGEST
jgi:hypothetical protein